MKTDITAKTMATTDITANNNNQYYSKKIHHSPAAMDSRAAIILLDIQNEFAKPGGKLHEDVKDVMAATGMLEKVPKLVGVARDAGALIIHCPVIMKTGVRFKDADFDPHAYAAMDGLFTEGSWNAQFIDEIQPQNGETILHGRNDFCAFEGTELLVILKRYKINTLFLCGFLSNICVEETARACSERIPDLRVIVCLDGCAAKTMQDHDNAMSLTLPLHGCEVVKCSEAEDLMRKVSVADPNEEGDTAGEATEDDAPRTKPRILAMHGARSNNYVTRLQLENLGITEERYDIVYFRGQVEVEEGDPDIAGLIHGPYYSWFESEGTNQRSSIISAVRDILRVNMISGPFDGVYGFSSGAILALLAAGIAEDPALRSAIESLEGDEEEKGIFRRMTRALSKRRNTERRLTAGANSQRKLTKGVNSQRRLTGGTKKRTGTRTKSHGFADMFKPGGSVESGDIIDPPFKFVILACAAMPFSDISALRRIAGLPVVKRLETNIFTTPSFHIIAMEDHFKGRSEEVASLFANRKVMYIPGGHAVSRDERKDQELQYEIKTFALAYGQPPPKLPVLSYKPVSEVSNVALLPHAQVALVQLDRSKLPCRKGEGATICSMLGEWPADRPFLRDSRNDDIRKCLTYGDTLNFIQGGKGDLRRLGVRPGNVVAYGAPPGGGAVPALAFLSIGSQTAAAPLAPGTAEPDALDALEQFQAKHLILFDDVNCPGVEAAFKIYSSMGKAKLHRARIVGGNQPGIFEFVDESGQSIMGDDLPGLPLKNKEDGTCLLLRTSGTTARPKGVPLRQDALVNNGAILAASMQLLETDVCYSVMPLFHIGGISASIMCTLASGGSVCCDGEPFDPSRMVDALHISKPQPTWYSSVPTIHNATVTFLKDSASSDPKYKEYGIDSNGVWKSGHSLRMIRSGAAALLGPDGEALAAAYGGVPIFPTYSMSEQMPISQPPAGKGDTMTDKPGSVGVPVAASIAIVNRSTLRPVAAGEEGEIAISGDTVLKNYLQNPDADRKSYFDLTLDIGSNMMAGDITTGGRYFLTGDTGTIDEDGFLSLKGRAKELIKKGGEQVSPFEVEEPLLSHPWIQIPVCFSVPSKLYGEEVGCALVLSSQAPVKVTQREVTSAMRAWLKEAKLAPIKWPTKWVIVNDEDLPKTKTKKYIRIGLSSALGLDPEKDEDNACTLKPKEPAKAKVDWAAISGLRFVLACYVMFMHIGSPESWGKMNNLRGFPWHVHVFFTLGGYSMASPMNPTIKNKFSYFKARIWSMYPMYAIALITCLINLLVVCRPSTFDPEFTYNSQSDDLERGFFCEGAPATPTSYWGSLVLTIVTYIFGLAVTPSFLLTWWLGYYLWFSSMYYQCLAFFPATYNVFMNRMRKKSRLLLKTIITLMLLNIIILLAAVFIAKDAPRYDDGDYDAAKNWNIGILSFYLFGPFWALYFVIGMVTAFLYDAYRPQEKHKAWIWGLVADGCTLVIVGLSFAHIFQGKSTYETNPDLELYMRPPFANQWTDTASVNRLWDAGYARMFCPLTTLWIFALSTGNGLSAKFFALPFLSETLAPHAYNCFLFHQVVAQWYFAATRPGSFWNWWQYRKKFYWFSPQPCPVEWYEYFCVVGFVVAWSHLMMNLEPVASSVLDWIVARIWGSGDEEEDEDTSQVLKDIIEGMTGIEPESDYTLEECGLASIGVPALVTLLNKNFSKGKREVTVVAADLVAAETIADMVEVIDKAKDLADAQGV